MLSLLCGITDVWYENRSCLNQAGHVPLHTSVKLLWRRRFKIWGSDYWIAYSKHGSLSTSCSHNTIDEVRRWRKSVATDLYSTSFGIHLQHDSKNTNPSDNAGGHSPDTGGREFPLQWASSSGWISTFETESAQLHEWHCRTDHTTDVSYTAREKERGRNHCLVQTTIKKLIVFNQFNTRQKWLDHKCNAIIT